MASYRMRGSAWYFRITTADGSKVERKGCPDRRATEQMARAAESHEAKVRAGLVDPREAGYARHGAMPLPTHLDDRRVFLAGKGATSDHAWRSRNRALRLLELADATRISDLSPSAMQGALTAVQEAGVSTQSIHHYARAVKSYTRWL